jgi:hypothetical protein
MMYGRWRHEPGNIAKLDSSLHRNLSRLRIAGAISSFTLFIGGHRSCLSLKERVYRRDGLIGPLLIGCIYISPLPADWAARFWAMGVGISLLLVAFALGIDSTRATLNEAGTETIYTVDGQLIAIVIRSGERGVLLYDRSRQSFAFRKWDSIKKAEWSRQPLASSAPLK